MKTPAKWTDDCCGKKDYDGNIVSISTRYWPSGGGFLLMNTDDPEPKLTLSIDPKSKPSANCSLTLDFIDDDGDREWVVLQEQDFKGDSFKNVKTQVEKWAQEQMDRLVGILKQHYEFKEPY